MGLALLLVLWGLLDFQLLQESFQLLRFLLKKMIAVITQISVDLGGITVAQLAA